MVAHSSITASTGPGREALLPSLSSLAAQTKESTCNAGDLGSISGSGRFPGEGNGYPLQYSCLKNSKWTVEAGGLQSMGSQRVKHNLVTSTFWQLKQTGNWSKINTAPIFDSLFTYDGRYWQPYASLHLIHVHKWKETSVGKAPHYVPRGPKSELNGVNYGWKGIVGSWWWGRWVFILLFRIKGFIIKTHLMIKLNKDIRLGITSPLKYTCIPLWYLKKIF